MSDQAKYWNWEDECAKAINDASRISNAAISDVEEKLAAKSLELQKQIADALLKQAYALQKRCEAMHLLYLGDTNGFMKKYGDSLKSTQESALDAAKWAQGVVAMPDLHDSYDTAAAKIAAIDKNFAERNDKGSSALIEKILAIASKIDVLVARSNINIEAIAENVKGKWMDYRTAFRSMAKHASEVAGDVVSFVASTSAVAVNSFHGHASRSFNAGKNIIVDRQASRYWDALNKAFHDGDVAGLERQILRHGNAQMLICGRDANDNPNRNMMDHALGSARAVMNANLPDGRVLLVRIQAVIELLDRHGIAPSAKTGDMLFSDSDVATIRSMMKSSIENNDFVKADDVSKNRTSIRS